MGYRKYAKDYVMEPVAQEGRGRKKAVRVYVGPYFRFQASPERVAWLKRYYGILLLVETAALALTLCLSCPFNHIWYVVMPAIACWLPWIFVTGATWRLWTAGERMEREHADALYDRMNGATLFLMALSVADVFGCVVAIFYRGATGLDYVVCAAQLIAAGCAVAMFARRKELALVSEPNPRANQS